MQNCKHEEEIFKTTKNNAVLDYAYVACFILANADLALLLKSQAYESSLPTNSSSFWMLITVCMLTLWILVKDCAQSSLKNQTCSNRSRDYNFPTHVALTL